MRTSDLEDGLTFTELLESILAISITIVFIALIPNVYVCFSVFILSWILYSTIPAPYNFILGLAGAWFFIFYISAWQTTKDPPFYAHVEWNKRIKFEHVYNMMHSEARRLIVSLFSDKDEEEK